MKKKGFTLIELLAVIVILAIIALIATPLVLKYIEKSRKESKVDSAYSFVRNLETEIANYSIKHNGSKFNKVPKNGKFYELTDFEADKDIDTMVKGDKPNSIKVCLSLLGQVDKAMFEYGKYYVSYDGKKSSISDKDTFDNFSCSGNGDVAQSDYLFDKNIEFAEYDGMIVGSYKFENEPLLNLEFPKFYGVTINNGEEIITRNMGGGLVDANNNAILYIIDGMLVVVNENNVAGNIPVSNINVKIRKVLADTKWFRVEADGKWDIYSEDFDICFSEGAANIKIEDNEGNSYFDMKDIQFLKDDGSDEVVIGTGSTNGLPKIPDLYTAVTNGKIITITVEQVVDGKKVVSIIGGNEHIVAGGDRYYWGIPHLKDNVS